MTEQIRVKNTQVEILSMDIVNDLMTRLASNTTSPLDSYRLSQSIRFLGETKQLGSAISLLQSASRSNVTINTHHFAALLQACRVNNQADLAEGLFERMHQYGVSRNTLLCNIMVAVYSEARRPALIAQTLLSMQREDIPLDAFSLSSAINGCVRSGAVAEAQVVVDIALESPHFTSTYVVNAVLNAYCSSRRWSEVSHTFERAQREGARLDAVSYSVLIKALGESRQIASAIAAFEDMSVRGVHRDVGAFNALVTAYERCGCWRESTQLLRSMRGAAIKPDKKTYCSVIACCGSAGQWTEAVSAFEDAKASGLRMDAAVYNALIDCLQKAGKWTLAMDVLKEGNETVGLLSSEYLSEEEAFRRARDVLALGVDDGSLSLCYLDEQGRRVLDLHSFPLSVAVTAVSLVFERMRSGVWLVAALRVVTGKGKHVNSSGTRGVLRAEIEAFIQREIRPLGLLTADRVAGNDGCVDFTEESIRRWVEASNKEQANAALLS